jgi:hypothetical protein
LNPFVGVLLNPKYTAVAQQAQELAEAARTVCRPIVFLDASTDAELDAAFATLARQRVVAVLVAGDPFSIRGAIRSSPSLHNRNCPLCDPVGAALS